MLTTFTNPSTLGFTPSHFPLPLSPNVSFIVKIPTAPLTFSSVPHHNIRLSRPSFAIHASSDGGTVDADTQESTSPAIKRSSNSSEEGYVALFIRMLGLDNDPLDREQAVVALWKYSQGGKDCIDGIMKFHGCINLTANLLRSDSSSSREAAAGLLRAITSVHLYIKSVEESGAVEEITALLSRSPQTPEVKEQSLCTLWNLSVDENIRVKIANSDILPILVKFLEDDEMKVKEAAAGLLANLALSQSNHMVMVEAGVIPKLAKVLKIDEEGYRIIRKAAKNALLEIAKDKFYRILVMEEGLVLVPLVGADAYKSVRPVSHSWPSFPDGTELERNSSIPSRYGASELLLGLNIQGKSFDLEEAKVNAIVGRTQQQFLARIGAIELEEGRKTNHETLQNQGFTLLPWIHGIARLIIILELEDVSAISRAALSIADASINEDMRMSFMVAGAVNRLIRLLKHNNENVKLAACHALERLSVSNDVCNMIEAEGAVSPLVDVLKCKETPESLMQKTVDILARVLDPGKEMKMKFYDGPVNGSAKPLYATRKAAATRGLGEEPDDMKVSKKTTREYVLESGVISSLVEILKKYPNLQRKAASILEYVATIEPSMDALIAADIESALTAVFCPKFVNEIEDDMGIQEQEISAIEVIEAGLAISAASRLLTKLLDIEQFRLSINSSNLKQSLRKLLMSNIPLDNKDWVAACLIKLESSFGSQVDPENSINKEVILYETIPRLIEQIRTSFSPELLETSVVELNAIVATGIVDFTKAVADKGGIFPLVKVIEGGSATAVEAGLAILFNLSMDSENHSAIIAAGAVPALRRIVLSQGPQWMRALNLLRSLPTQ